MWNVPTYNKYTHGHTCNLDLTEAWAVVFSVTLFNIIMLS